MTAEELETIRRSYDSVAGDYTARLANELEGKPLDLAWLDRFAARLQGAGFVCDLGCGPGHVARYLWDAGVDVFGLDLSPAMVAEASRLNPQISFCEGNMLALELEAGSLAGIVAFYAIVNLTMADIGKALREMRRVLRSGGQLLLAFHVGNETVHLDELWGRPVALDFRFFPSRNILQALAESGFEIGQAIERDPYPDAEYPSRRAYMMAEARPVLTR
jgi:ubiquinone/menaquinone biosynthesis C-methylase UbiE